MRGAKRAVQLCCTSDLQRRSAPKVSESNVHIICEQALSALRWNAFNGQPDTKMRTHAWPNEHICASGVALAVWFHCRWILPPGVFTTIASNACV